MVYQQLRCILTGQCQSAGVRLLRAILWPFGQIYGTAMAMRAFAYQRQWLASFSVPVPVISIGNLASGGTGKTPFAAFLCRRLIELGRRPAVLVRGYGARRGVISDEALWLAKHAGGAIVQVDADRVRGAKSALQAGVDVIVLDDGFQHLRLKRDLDVVLVDTTSPWPGDCPLPGGLLREFPHALRRAHIVCLTRCDQAGAEKAAKIEAEVRAWAPQATILRASHIPARLADFSGAIYDLQTLNGCRVIAFCGIGNPCAFIATLRALKAEVVVERFYPDHHAYALPEVCAVEDTAAKMSALIACTEKDATKLSFFVQNPRQWRILGVDLMMEDERPLMARLQSCLIYG